MRGKPWSVDQERQLRLLLQEGRSADEVAVALGKTRLAVRAKVFNLGLSLKETAAPKDFAVSSVATTTSSAAPALPPPPAAVPAPALASDALPPGADGADGSGLGPKGQPGPPGEPSLQIELELPEVLPSIQEELKVMAAAIKAMNRPGISRFEFQRLQGIVQSITKYMDYYAKFLNYSKIEKDMQRLRAELAKEKAKKAN